MGVVAGDAFVFRDMRRSTLRRKRRPQPMIAARKAVKSILVSLSVILACTGDGELGGLDSSMAKSSPVRAC